MIFPVICFVPSHVLHPNTPETKSHSSSFQCLDNHPFCICFKCNLFPDCSSLPIPTGLLQGLLHEISVPPAAQANLLRPTAVPDAHEDTATIPSIFTDGDLETAGVAVLFVLGRKVKEKNISKKSWSGEYVWIRAFELDHYNLHSLSRNIEP